MLACWDGQGGGQSLEDCVGCGTETLDEAAERVEIAGDYWGVWEGGVGELQKPVAWEL